MSKRNQKAFTNRAQRRATVEVMAYLRQESAWNLFKLILAIKRMSHPQFATRLRAIGITPPGFR